MIITGKPRGKLINFNRNAMTDKPIVIDSFEHCEFPDGHVGDFYVLAYPDGKHRMVYNMWEMGDREYNSLILVKEGAEKNITKDGKYARIKGTLERHLSTAEDVSSFSPIIKEWETTQIPTRKKKAEDYINAHRPVAKHNSIAAEKTKKAANG